MTLYKGFSTHNRLKRYVVTDYDLIKQDLFNHINIRKGEKLMNPSFGCNIWNLIFEPFTSEIKDTIIDEISTIVSADPRVLLEQTVIDEYEHGLNLTITLRFVSTNQLDSLHVIFNRVTQTAYNQ